MSLSTSDALTLIGVIGSTITASCAIFVSFLALQQTARPRINVRLKSGATYPVDTETKFVFRVTNVGHWYGSPAALGIAVYCNFEPAFTLSEMRYGSTQETISTHLRLGSKGKVYIRAKEIKLTHRGDAEDFHLIGTTPERAGRYCIQLRAFSENEASFKEDVWITVL